MPYIALLMVGLVVLTATQADVFPAASGCDPATQSCAPGATPKECKARQCFTTREAQEDYETKNNCKFAKKDCTEQWRFDEEFLGESEGLLKTDGYVPTYEEDIKDKKGNIIYKTGDVIGSSGVTISTGVDLGQQSAKGTRGVIDAYIKDNGNPAKVDVDALMKKLDPYFGLKKQKAMDALDKTPLTVTLSEAKLLAKSFSYDTQVRVAKKFDANNTKSMVFKQLPEEAQTVIIDFAYQYGLSTTSGSVRQTFWKYAYDGEWKKLADWLKGKPDQYKSRRGREGVRLQDGIDSGLLPESGDPCASAGTPKP